MKPSPSALGDYLLHPQDGNLPLKAEEIFGRQAPLAVEVGFGGGEYLDWWASKQPDWDFVGIELPLDCIFRAANRFEDSKRSNVRLVQGDARYLLRELFAAGSLRHVLMQFPMPWPKDKHAKHRVSSPGFAATLADVLQPGCSFELVTDQEWYAQETETHLSANPAFDVIPVETNPERPFRTRYEGKWLEEGRQIFRLLVTLKTPAQAPRTLKIEQMETLHVKKVPTAGAVEALVGQRFEHGFGVGQVKEVFRSHDGWMLRILAADEAFSQLFHARIVVKNSDRCLLRIDEVPRPYYTATVRHTLGSIARVLQTE